MNYVYIKTLDWGHRQGKQIYMLLYVRRPYNPISTDNFSMSEDNRTNRVVSLDDWLCATSKVNVYMLSWKRSYCQEKRFEYFMWISCALVKIYKSTFLVEYDPSKESNTSTNQSQKLNIISIFRRINMTTAMRSCTNS